MLFRSDVVVVSEDAYQHVFDQDDDLLFIGHDFLFYLWDNEEKIKRWQSYSQKHKLWLWCFERIDAIVPQWRQKSHVSVSIASKFCERILACDEDDCDKYGFDWLPQWASKKFYDRRGVQPSSGKILFSGQAGGPEYHMRNSMLESIAKDDDLSRHIEITNTRRTFSWDDYIDNLLKHDVILNPIGILRAMNTRSFEALYSGRILLQNTSGRYRRHEEFLKDQQGIVFFEKIDDVKRKIINREYEKGSPEDAYTNHSLYARMKSIGIDLE